MYFAVVTAAVALTQLFTLTRSCAKNQRFIYGAWFWVCIGCGVSSTLIFFTTLGPVGLAFAAPAYVLFAHMLYVQHQIAAHEQLS